MIYTLTTEHSFDAAHFLKGHSGACQYVHGHRWRVVMEVAGDELHPDGSSRGMIMDFTDMKKEFRRLIDEFDHSFIVESEEYSEDKHHITYQEVMIRGDFDTTVSNSRVIYVPFRPTAELFSQYFYRALQAKGYPVYAMTVYETPTNACRYCPIEGGK